MLRGNWLHRKEKVSHAIALKLKTTEVLNDPSHAVPQNPSVTTYKHVPIKRILNQITILSQLLQTNHEMKHETKDVRTENLTKRIIKMKHETKDIRKKNFTNESWNELPNETQSYKK